MMAVITIRFRGGGHKRLYRQIDFRRDKVGIPAKVAGRLNMTPIAPPELPCCTIKMGRSDTYWRRSALRLVMTFESGAGQRFVQAMRWRWLNIPLGTTIHNIELSQVRVVN